MKIDCWGGWFTQTIGLDEHGPASPLNLVATFSTIKHGIFLDCLEGNIPGVDYFTII